MKPTWILSHLDEQSVPVQVVQRYQQLADAAHLAPDTNSPDLLIQAAQEWPVMLSSYRQVDPWHVFLLLTPWMLARLLLPIRDPGLPLPDNWGSADSMAENGLLGPLQEVSLLGQKQWAHLHRDAVLGDYLMQPLVQALHRYANPEAVFAAWTATVQRRDALLQASKKRCDWQQDLSRREMFAGLFRRGKEAVTASQESV